MATDATGARLAAGAVVQLIGNRVMVDYRPLGVVVDIDNDSDSAELREVEVSMRVWWGRDGVADFARQHEPPVFFGEDLFLIAAPAPDVDPWELVMNLAYADHPASPSRARIAELRVRDRVAAELWDCRATPWHAEKG